MKIQLLSDLHLETESFEPQPAPQAELLVLAGDIDTTWQGFERFCGWPVPVLVVAGNHEFDGRELDTAWPALRAHCTRLGLRLLERESAVLADRGGRRLRFLGTIRWSDFDLFGAAGRPRALRAAAYFQRLMGATAGGRPFDAEAVREQALACRAWLAEALREPAAGRWDATVVITHFAPSLRSADVRYGRSPSTASFCNADDDLVARSNGWLHGHLHCRHDYLLEGSAGVPVRVVCQGRGLASKGEDANYDAVRIFEF
jgi:hypothetical protein